MTPDELRSRNRSALDRVRDDAREALERLAFTSAIEAVSSRESRLRAVRGELERLRTRRFAWRSDLEPKLAEVEGRARPMMAEVRMEADRAARDLRDDAERLANHAGSVAGDLAHAGATIDRLENEARNLDTQLDAAERRIDAVTESFIATFDEVEETLRTTHEMLDAFDAASFSLLAGEDPVAATAAEWVDGPEGAKNGLLVLTNQRVRFEQKEEIKKGGGWFGWGATKEKVQQLLIDEPVGHLAASEDSTSGLVFKDQILAFTWAPAARCGRKTTIHMKTGTSKMWDGVVESLRSGEIERQRYRPGASGPPPIPDQPQWPSACRDCGGKLPAPLRGQTRLVCEYCGAGHDPS